MRMPNRLKVLGLALLVLGAGCGQDKVGTPGQGLAGAPTPPLEISKPPMPPSEFEGQDLREADADSLASVADTLYREGKAREAAQLLRYAVEEGVPQQYNLACYNALAGDVEAAFYWLQVAAIDEGVDASWAKQDSDLASLRRDPRWSKVAPYLDACNAHWAGSGHVVTSLVVPSDYKAGTPIGLVVGLHGLGADPEGLVDESWQGFADATGRAIVAVSGTRPTGKHSFVWSEDREQDHQHIQKALAGLSDQVTIEPGHVVLFGFSQGAQMGFEVAMAHPESYRGTLVMSPGGSRWTINEGLSPRPENASQHYVLTCGAEEHPGNVAFTRQDAELAESAGARVELKLYEGVSDHAFPPDFFEQFPRWVRFLAGEEAAP